VTVVVGTAGHIDHGKTSLLRALTGIDADRLPEERRRGMTIDVGYAHLALEDGTVLDFVDVPGHDRLVGNMLVGAGEIDAALLVVAADDGVRAQTLEHLELLDALGIADGIAVVTKWDLLATDDPRREVLVDDVRRLLSGTSLAGVPVIAASAATGEGLAGVRAALLILRERVEARPRRGPTRLAVDRVFSIRGRGTVVTGTLRGGSLATGETLRVEPGGFPVRARELQVHGRRVPSVEGGGRVALNVSGPRTGTIRRGLVVTVGAGVTAGDRLLVALAPPAVLQLDHLDRRERGRWPIANDASVRLHVGTEQATARVRRSAREATGLESGEDVVRLVLDRPVAVMPGDRIVLRWPSPGVTAAGGRVLDPAPAAGASRRRGTPARVAALVAAATPDAVVAALVALHGVLPDAAEADVRSAWRPVAPSSPAPASPSVPSGSPVSMPSSADSRRPAVADARRLGRWLVAEDVASTLEAAALAEVAARHARDPLARGLPLSELRPAMARHLRRAVTLSAADAAAVVNALVDELVVAGRVAREGDVLRDPRWVPGPPPAVVAAMARLEAALDVPAPPSLADAARAAGCPPEGVRALEAAGRIVRLDPSLAWATTTYRRLEELAVSLAERGPLTPAAFRDATGTSRKYSLAVLEDLDRRGVLRRTPDGHVAAQPGSWR
jgi:selenocysteine-specific elongation factor